MIYFMKILDIPLPHTEYSVTWSSTVPLPHNECAVTLSTAVLIPHTEYSLPGETGVDYWLEPTTWFRIMGKELCFHKIGPIMMPKRIGYKIFTIFFYLHVWETRWPKQVQQISWNALLKYILELVASDIHHADKYWIIVGQKVTFLTVYTMFLEKYPFVYLRDQVILIGAWGRCKCKLSYENNNATWQKTIKKNCPMVDSKKKRPSPMTFSHFFPILWDKIFYIAVNRILFIGTVVKKYYDSW